VKKICLDGKVLKYKNIILKAIDIDCFDDFYNHSIQKKLFDFMEYHSFQKKSVLKYLNRIIKESLSSKIQYWKIIYNKKFAGTISLRNLNIELRSAEISFAITPKYWRRGVFSSAANILFKYAKKKKIKFIYAKTRIDNTPSIISLLKLKFKTKKLLKNFYIKNNIYYNAFFFEKKL
jgi:RimJ/RimL family protein N-acetyltransferase